MVLEIVIAAVGVALLILGYVIPARKEDEDIETFSRDQVQEMVSEEVDSVKGRIDDIVDETITYAMEKTERSMDRLSNEKMMAVSEYSDSVLDQINKSHEEVVFLYDMLNDKHENLKETVAEATRTASEVKERVKEAEEIVPVVSEAAEEASKTVEAARVASKSAVESVVEPVISEQRPKNKPVPIIKNEPVASPVMPQLSDDEDMNDDYAEEEWEDLDDTDDEDYGDENDGPEISFNPRSPGSRNSNERILELHKAGKSNMAIAKELGLGIGEVKLVIDLFKGN